MGKGNTKTDAKAKPIEWHVEHHELTLSGQVISTYSLFGTAESATEAAILSRHALATLRGEDAHPPTGEDDRSEALHARDAARAMGAGHGVRSGEADLKK